MLIVVSPAKTLDYDSELPSVRATQPRMLDDSQQLIKGLRQLSAKDIGGLMNISDKLSELNRDRFQQWQPPFSKDNARPAVFAFKGDVYTGLEVETLDKEGVAATQKQLRILSGLYGLLRPLDYMQPYRLEMGTRYANEAGKDLYAFWDERITELLLKDLKAAKTDVLINLASQEYYKSVKPALLKAAGIRVIEPVFQDEKAGKYKIISFFAKKARGMMARWIIENNIDDVKGLEGFDVAGYAFSAADSQGDKMVFRRSEKAAKANS